MTSSARDSVYGRQGGRWLEVRSDSGACDTCRNSDARWRATRGDEQWQVCERCRSQGVRLGCQITHEPLRST